jgi:uncharacterized protein YacL
MVCVNTCVLATAFIVGTIFAMSACRYEGVFQKYERSLTREQAVAYQRITQERLWLYIGGTFLGVVLALLYGMGYGQRTKAVVNGCAFLVIVFAVQYFYYVMMPKNDWMLLHLTNQEQTKNWLEVYRHMSVRWHLGFVVGLVGAFLLGYGIGC